MGGVEEEPSDSEGGASEVDNVASGEDGATVADSGEEKDKQIEEERREVEPAMSQSASAVMDSTSCKYCTLRFVCLDDKLWFDNQSYPSNFVSCSSTPPHPTCLLLISNSVLSD